MQFNPKKKNSMLTNPPLLANSSFQGSSLTKDWPP